MRARHIAVVLMSLGMSLAAFANETCRTQVEMLLAEEANASLENERLEIVQIEAVNEHDVRKGVDVTN